MQRRATGKAAITGAAVVAVYLVSALISGRLSPLARRPLLDGAHGPAPYNWVNPPPEQAQANQKPAAASESIALTAKGTGQALIAAGDQQATLQLPDAAVPASKGRTKVEVKIDPLDATTLGPPPGKYVIRGNAYRLAMRYTPGGVGVKALAKPGNLVLKYPAPTPPLLGVAHELLFSVDGQQWTKIQAEDQHGTQQITASINQGGYFAVAAQQKDADAKKKKGKPFPWLLMILIVAGVSIVAGTAFLIVRKRDEARRRKERRQALARKSRSTKKRR